MYTSYEVALCLSCEFSLMHGLRKEEGLSFPARPRTPVMATLHSHWTGGMGIDPSGTKIRKSQAV